VISGRSAILPRAKNRLTGVGHRRKIAARGTPYSATTSPPAARPARKSSNPRNRAIGASKITDAASAAATASYLAKGPQARFDALVTGAKSKPLAGSGRSKASSTSGLFTPRSCSPRRSAVRALRTFVRPQPHAGEPTLNEAGNVILQPLEHVFADSGIAVRGLMAIAPRMSTARAAFATRPTGKLAEKHTEPEQVLDVIPEVAAGQFGVVLMDVAGSGARPHRPRHSVEASTLHSRG